MHVQIHYLSHLFANLFRPKQKKATTERKPKKPKFDDFEDVEVSAFFSKPAGSTKSEEPQVPKSTKPAAKPAPQEPPKSKSEPGSSSKPLKQTPSVKPDLDAVSNTEPEVAPKQQKKKEAEKPFIIDDDMLDDDDLFDEEFEALAAKPVMSKKSTEKASTSTKNAPESSKPPVTASGHSSSKPSAPPSKPTAATSKSGSSAEDVLKAIPDAVLPDVDPEKKTNYFALKAAQASGPQSTGNVDIPTSRPNCLAGLTFVFTGTMPTLPRDQAIDIVKGLGGKVTTAPSSKTSCVVLGGDAGPSKILKIQKLKIKAIDEDGFLQLLREMPADGGSGQAAQKAIAKQHEEKKKVENAVKEMEKSMASESRKGKGSESKKAADREPSQLWTTKYAPTDLSHICGNKGQVEKLGRWLSNWRSNAKIGFSRPGTDGTGVYRAVLISGPPGIGKTTTAHLVAKLKGFDVVESNASDTRSKNMLISNVSGSIKNTSLNGFFGTTADEAIKSSKKNLCLIMDEVDGMSGGDRGGVGQMAAICRTTNVPIILICNERSLPKMRPFDKVTLDMPFRRPDAAALRVRIMSIANREGIQLTPNVIDQLVSASGSDMRQIINMLYTFSRTNKSMDYENSKEFSKKFEKVVTLKSFDITGKLLSGSTHTPNNGITLDDKIRYYFDDHDFTPLMIQENYLNTVPNTVNTGKFKSHLDAVVAASEAISDGDLVDRKIHGSQPQWSLMPFHGFMSSVMPSSYIAGQVRGRFNFTTYLGQNSKANKYQRLLQEIQAHTRLRISGDRRELRLQYFPLLAYKLMTPILTEKDAGVPKTIELMDDYFLTKEDWDVVAELGVGNGNYEARVKALPSTVKSAFTRTYNKASHPVPYMKSASNFSTKATAATMSSDVPDLEETVGEETAPPEEDAGGDDEDDDMSKDKYIKMSKPKAPAKRGAKKAATAAGASGKGGARGKGRASTK